MFSNYDASCGSAAVHSEHWRWKDMFDRVYCRGVFKYETKDPSAVDVIAQFDRDRRPPKPPPHKHMFRFSGVSWQGKIGAVQKSHDEDLNFYCERCPDKRYPVRSRIKRWRYRDMTMNLSKVEQTWPQ